MQIRSSFKASDPLADYQKRLRLARAGELARSGRMLEAEVLLCPGGNFPRDVEELDILARIQVLHGRFADAKATWEAAAVCGGEAHRFELQLRELARFKIACEKREHLLHLALAAVFAISLVLMVLAWKKG
jgi:hypothetical protein